MSLLNVDIKSAGYESSKDIIQQIKFSIGKGELIGLIGPNGAGKSTTIKSILGLIEHFDGEILFAKEKSYSYIPERPMFYDDLTLWEHLDFIAAMEGMEESEFRRGAEELLKLYKLNERIHEFPATFSKGMQQKVMLILAQITKPSIYIIDEPFVGLDPEAMRIFLTSMEKERKRGVGILMCTHVLDTAERVCDRFLLVSGGKLRASGALAEIREQCGLEEGSLYDCFYKIGESGND